MKKYPEISVCMPVYNREDYINECIDSILHQSFQNFEIIIVDDGSTDNTCAIIKSYQDSRIKLVKNRHNYIESTNLLFELAQGKYIARIDSDDIMLPKRLETQYFFLEEHPDIDILGEVMKLSDRNLKSIHHKKLVNWRCMIFLKDVV